MKFNKLSNMFSLVIPTYNRYPSLLRLLEFYQSYQFPFKIVALDSSSDPLKLESLKNLLAHENIIYRKFDPDIPIWEKIARGVEDIVTPYAALCADDDFIIPSAVGHCIQFLEKNHDYSCTQGIIVHHSFFSNFETGRFKWIPTYYKMGSNTYDLPHERLHAYFSNKGKSGGQHFYAVHRSEILQLIWRESVKYVSDYHWGELFAGGLSLLYGRRKFLPIFYSSRESHSYSPFDENYQRECFSLGKCEKAIRGIAAHLQKAEDLDYETAELMTRRSVNACVDRALSSRKSDFSPSFVQKIINKILVLKNYSLHIVYCILYWWIIGRVSSPFYPDFQKVKNAVVSAGLGTKEHSHSRKTYKLFQSINQ